MSASREKAVAIKDFGDYVYQNSIDNFSHQFDVELLEKANGDLANAKSPM